MTTKTDRADLDVLKGLPSRAKEIVTDYRRKASATNGKTLLTEQERAAHIAKLQSTASKRLSKLSDEGEAAYRRLTAAPKAAAGSTEEQTLSELRQQRAWTRVKGLLDASLKPNADGDLDALQIIRDEIASNDPNAIAVLRAELPSYLTTNGLPVYRDILPTLFKSAQVEQPAAKAANQELERGWKRVQVGLAQATSALSDFTEDGSDRTPYDREYDLVDFENGALVTVEAVPYATPEKDSFDRPTQTKNLPDLEPVF